MRGGLAAARRRVVLGRLPCTAGRDPLARAEWAAAGLTLAQRDRALDELVELGLATVTATDCGIRAEAAPAPESEA